ncbi:hypothetical protein RRG08_012245 [Elysia crispata]|uniref:Uncharacterized protein n=1 Tax=Elysia crispata TaxID=231223 RepID=A0AAE0Y8L5_9GAST|nr:hypothetical protein RRG08_012245 [Elysia crispata]
MWQTRPNTSPAIPSQSHKQTESHQLENSAAKNRAVESHPNLLTMENDLHTRNKPQGYMLCEATHINAGARDINQLSQTTLDTEGRLDLNLSQFRGASDRENVARTLNFL